MSRYLVLYTFHRLDALSLHRLARLKRMNPNVTIVPCFGIPQRIYFPSLMRPPKYAHTLNWTVLRSAMFHKLTRVMNEKVESVRRRADIDAVRDLLRRMGLALHCDFTPMGKINQDLAILNWFSVEGRNYDFEFLIYFEYDMFSTQTIESLYSKYSHYDAGFVDYRKAHLSWYWSQHPAGARESVCAWLKDRNRKPVLYAGFFPGHMISREALATLAGLRLPRAFCEMRLPSVLTGLGFSCVRLDFPMLRYRPAFSKLDIESKSSFGLFHPVYNDFDL